MIIPNINKTEGNGCSVLVVKIITRARNFLPSGGIYFNENISIYIHDAFNLFFKLINDTSLLLLQKNNITGGK